jgi:hypothetical protein
MVVKILSRSFFKIPAKNNVLLFLWKWGNSKILMREKKQSKENEKVREIVSKNQEVIEALKRLSTLISNDQSIVITSSDFNEADSNITELKD